MPRKMKNSGIDFIGQIPENWNITKYKYCGVSRMGKTITKEDLIEDGKIPVYSATQDDSIFGYIDDSDLVLNKGDLVIGARGTIGFPTLVKDEIATCTQTTICTKVNTNINSSFLRYITLTFQDDWNPNEGSGVPQLTVAKLNNGYLPIPSKTEQDLIATKLDEIVSKIDMLISEHEKDIEDLEDYKKAVITEAVIKGLDKTVKMKESGFNHIKEYPSDWKINKTKYDYYLKGRIGWQGLTTAEYIDEGPFLITGTDFDNGRINWNTCVHVSEDRYNQAPEIMIQNGDVLITKDGTIGKVAIVEGMPDKTTLNSGVMVMRNINHNIKQKFWYYILISNEFKDWFNYINAGATTISHLYQHDFENFNFAIPDLITQEKIIEFLDKKCLKINNLIAEKEALIEDLKSYKKSVIFEYVTGKKEI